jgi:hypothetical protein
MKRDRNFSASLTFKNVKFDFTQLGQETQIGLINTGFDAYDFTFSPSVSSCKLKISDLQSKTSDCILNIPSEEKSYIGKKEYFQTAMYVCKINPEERITHLYLKLENVQMNGNIETPIWHPKFRLGLFLVKDLIKNQYQALDFVPTDNLKEFDLSLVPQDNPIPLKPHGGMTGSKIAKAIGYYPGPESAFTGWKAVAVTFGRLNEFMVLMQYLHFHANYSAKEIGWVGLRQDSNDGCQPDAIIFDQDRNSFPLEIKCSRSNCLFEGSHIAQCVWEMACNKSPYMDLVKYCEKSINVSGNVWKKHRECKEIRIYRSEELENELIKRTLDPELVKKFDVLAEECNRNAVSIPVDETIIDKIQAYKDLHLGKKEGGIEREEDLLLDRIEKRQNRIFMAFQGEEKDQMINEIFEQVNDFGELIRAIE